MSDTFRSIRKVLMTEKLEKKIKAFPSSPGVYQFIGSNGDILYVGKAKNLKNRIKSYFLKDIGRGPWIDIMVPLAKDIKYIETDSEIEAVLLEAELINKLKPKYNARLKDDKSFLVIKITRKISKSKFLISKQIPNFKYQIQNELTDQRINGSTNSYPELFPCVELVRFKNVDMKDKSAYYFGPYPAGLMLKKSLNFLRKIFPFRDCSKTKYKTYRKKGRPCIYGDIRVCTAPCSDWVDQKQYEKNIKYLIDFLRGKKEKIYRDLKKDMEILSKSRRFEEAGLVRDKLRALDHLRDVAIGLRDDVFNGSNTLFKRIECYDISNIGENYAVGAMIVFTDGKKDSDEYRKFKIQNSKVKMTIKNSKPELPKDDLLRLQQVLERRFKNNWKLPDLVVIDGGENQLKVAVEILKKHKLNILAISIAKGPKRKKNEFHFSNENIAKYFHKNSYLQNLCISARDEAHRFAINYYRTLHKKGMLEN